VIVVRALQPRKVESPIVVTPSGMVTEVREEQDSKAPCSMLLTLVGRTTFVKAVQPAKQNTPTLVTPLGIVTLVMVVALRNVSESMLVTGNPSILLGMTTTREVP